MPTISQDEVVETRTWSSGVEIIAHVNWSQIARVRRALGFAGDCLGVVQFAPPAELPSLILHGGKGSKPAKARAA